MGGLFLDVHIAYLIKQVIRLIQMRGSAAWSYTAATVASARWSPGGFGCSTAEIVYLYEVEGEKFSGTNQKPFVLPSSAGNYAARFPEGSKMVVRLKPGKPEISVVRDSDQVSSFLNEANFNVPGFVLPDNKAR